MTESAFIKISLLLQYLRIFKAGAMRWVCIILIILVAMWGIGFSFSGWFSCECRLKTVRRAKRTDSNDL